MQHALGAWALHVRHHRIWLPMHLSRIFHAWRTAVQRIARHRRVVHGMARVRQERMSGAVLLAWRLACRDARVRMHVVEIQRLQVREHVACM